MNHVNTMNKETVKREPDWFINGTKTVQQWVKKHYSVSSVPFIPESRLCGRERKQRPRGASNYLDKHLQLATQIPNVLLDDEIR